MSAYTGTTAKAFNSLLFQHSSIPVTLLSDLGTSFVAKLLHEVNDFLKMKLQRASLKQL